MKTIIAENWQKETVYLDAFEESNTLMDLQVLSFSAWIQSHSDLEVESFPLLAACRRLKAIEPNLTLCKEMLQDPAFLQQVLDFYQALMDFGCSIDQLPTTTPLQIEMKLLLEACQGIITPAHLIQDVFNKTETVRDVEIHTEGIQNYATFLAVQDFHTKGLKMIEGPQTHPQQIHFYHALNFRQEIEACAQMICTQKIPLNQINVILCGFNDNLNYLKLIFDYYGLHYGIVEQTRNSKAVESFSLLSRYFKEESPVTFQAMLNTSLFEKFDTAALMEYITLFPQAFNLKEEPHHVQDTVDTMIHLNSSKKKHLLHLEEIVQEQRLKLIEFLDSDESSPFLRAYNLLRKSELIQNKEERNCLSQIRTLLNHCGTSSLSELEERCVLAAVEKIMIKNTQSAIDCIQVTDLSKPIKKRPYCFVLNATSKNYPGTNVYKGLFEENYIALIPGFPSKVQRATFFNQRQAWILNQTGVLYLSYAISTYEGKGLECAFEVKNFAKTNSISWPLIQRNQIPVSQHRLSQESAQKLFLQENRLKGSVSSFERFWRCPYSYFLHTGLQLRNTDEIALDQALVGSIQHACIEECIELYGHHYAEIDETALRHIIHKHFDPIHIFFTNQDWNSLSIEERCFESLSLQFEFLKDLEKNTDLTLHQCEVEFEHVLFEEEPISIELHGIIDRIDANLNCLRVLDYKSSSKSLSASKIEAGLQLQLLTYLMIAVKQQQTKPAGAYYYSLKNDDITIEAAKLNLRNNELEILDEETYYTKWKKEHRLSGITTDSTMENDNDGSHIVGWTAKGPSSAQLKDYDELIVTLQDLYHTLKNRLLSGQIDCTPVEQACTFCDFGSICRYNGQLYKKNITAQEIEEEREIHA